MTVTDNAEDKVVLSTIETPTLTKAELAELLFDRLGVEQA